MKTKKLIKRTAAFCLTLAGFCAAQSAFAEVTVPEWQNSFTTAPTQAFYLYNTAKGKFATNSLTLVDDESKATTWTYSNKKLKTNGQYLYRNKNKVLEFNDSQNSDFNLSYSNEKWALSWYSWPSNYYIHASSDLKLEFGGTTAIYEWYFISENQWKNHNSLETIKALLADAKEYLDKAEEGEAKTALSNAIVTAETTIETPCATINENVEVENVSATITDATETLKTALETYKTTIRGQFVTALNDAITEAEAFTPAFEFLTSAIESANAAKDDASLSADELDAAKSALEGVMAQAEAITESDEYKTYLAYVQQITGNNTKAADAGYTGYDAATSTAAVSTAEADLLKIEAATGLTGINNTLKEQVVLTTGNYARYAGAEAVVDQAAKVGYTADLAAIKAAAVTELPNLIAGIRADATNTESVLNYIANHEGDEPFDMTIFINNNSFELGDATGWTFETNLTGSPDNGARLNYMDYATSGGHGSYICNSWKEYWGSSRGFGVYQYITGLPNGKYELKALLTSDAGNKIYLTVSADRNKQTKVGEGVTSENGKGEFVEASCEFNVYNGAVTIGAQGDNNAWFRADNFRLTLLSGAASFDEEATEYAYTSDPLPVIKVKREIKANQWTTLCLPMECAKPESLTLYEVTGETEDNGRISVTVAASSDEKIKAGKPYIVKNADAVISEFISNGVSLVEAPKTAGEFIPFTGLFTTTELNAGDIYVSTSADNAEGDKPVYKSLSETATNKNMKGFRAYFKVPAETAESSVRFVTEGDITGIMQAIEEQQTFAGAYSLSGHKVNTLQKGIYVIDGKKIIIK